jgi:hypothetical protein
MLRPTKPLAPFLAVAIAASSVPVARMAHAQDLAPLPPPPAPPPPQYGGDATAPNTSLPPPPPPPYGSQEPGSQEPSYGPPPSSAPSTGAPPPPYGPPRGARARTGAGQAVRFEPDQPGLRMMTLSAEVPVTRFGGFHHSWWYERGYAPVYAPVCDAPCDARLEAGTYHLAVSKDGGRPVPAQEVAVIRGPSTVHSEYVDQAGARAAGWTIAIAGTIGGVVMIAASVTSHDTCDASGFCTRHETTDGPLLGGGIAVLVGSGIVGSLLASQRDIAHVFVEPLSLGLPAGKRELYPVALESRAAAQGAALGLRF